ncbi:hypothetical protein Pryu01_02949 [Paraliobacillus ryukyuensis]|uniref:Uncharacterized protein n=1 Tax=Paraliobacillus ryukyuensis TaxID=200904 RepID=A0A366DS67_9BACI|nr:hypothetical protein [Paraliobacillus ryukyuensis]RBO92319.1 hypothetical protein DES48_11418 [Paraliobacillus ryukyuensis]
MQNHFIIEMLGLKTSMWVFGICIVNEMFSLWCFALYQGEKAEVPIFMYLFNNGYIENVNNTIKVAKPLSYGSKDFE